jgi:phenylacetate-coenzyme A ligase PaaK-like adenylate-forming protein
MRQLLSVQELRSLNPMQIERLQNVKFHACAKNLLPHTKFYANLFKECGVDPDKLKKVEDWHKQGLPLVKKFYYMKHVEDFVVKPEDPFKTHLSYLRDLSTGAAFDLALKVIDKPMLAKTLHDFYHPKMPLFSGGTQSGKPTPTLITTTQLRNLNNVMGISAQLMSQDYFKDTVGMNLFPYGPHLAWHAVQSAFNQGVDLNLATAAGGAMRTKDLVEMADKFKANVFAGMAKYMANRFLPMAVKKKIKLRQNVLFINGSEPMLPKDKEKILSLSKKLGAKNPLMLDFYGASEMKEDIFIECLPGSGYHHIAPLSTIVKTIKINHIKKGDFIDDWEFTSPEKGGAAVIWNISGAGTVLHGYLIGDKYEKIIKGRCPNCRLNTERVYGVSRLKLK